MFTPQLADYDGDGRLDLIAGSDCCQEACFYVFRRSSSLTTTTSAPTS